MPLAALKSLAKKAKKPLAKAEELWDKSAEIVQRQYPKEAELKGDDYYKLRMGVLKKALGLSEVTDDEEEALASLCEAGAITTLLGALAGQGRGIICRASQCENWRAGRCGIDFADITITRLRTCDKYIRRSVTKG